MPADVQIATARAVPDPERIGAWVEAALAGAAPAGAAASQGELCVRVVDADESRELNTRFRDKPSPTNVLSFPAAIDLPGTLVWGDVVVCAPVVLAEAEAQGKTFEAHFAHMVVHGVLHLLGYDHESAPDAERMETLETQILGRFDIDDPYRER